MEKSLLNLLQDKAGKMASGKKHMEYLIGGLVFLVFLVALAPTIFGGLNNLTGVDGVPTWFTTVGLIVIGGGLIFVLIEYFMGK